MANRQKQIPAHSRMAFILKSRVRSPERDCNPGVKPYPIPELPTTIAFPKARKSINFVK